MRIPTLCCSIILAMAACGGSKPAPQAPPSGDTPPASPGRQALVQADCEAQGGRVVGDIGDGATQRPDYVCPSGKPPLGNITAAPGGPIAIEGAVCCPP